MHIPDGFLTPQVWIPMAAVSAGALAYSSYRASRSLSDMAIPLMGVMGAFVFAAQMIQFPVLAGTSGHLMGGVLLTALLGPYASVVVMTCVLFIQWLLFQDGGLTALGANIFNMGVISALLGGVLIKLARRRSENTGWLYFSAVCASAWLATLLSAAAAASQLALSEVAAFVPVFTAMVGVHALIGIGEALITVLVLRFIKGIRPDLLLYGIK